MTTYFVAPDGHDTWSGTHATRVGRSRRGPWRTLARALAAVAAARAAQPRQGVTVVLRGGTYYLPETLVLDGAHSGTAGHPTILTAYPGETPLLSGGVHLTGWQVGTVHGRPCWTLDLPAVAAGEWEFTQLFVDGQRRSRPRLPKTGFYHFADRRPTDFPDGLVRYGNGPTHAYYGAGDLRAFHNLTDVKLVMYQAWYETHHRLRAVDTGERRVEFQSRGFSGGYTGPHSRYQVDNVFEALDTPGEWYLDRPAGRLYYLPLPDEVLGAVTIVAPRLATLLHLRGTAAQPVAHLRLEHLAFAHTEWDYAPDFGGSLQAADLVPGALKLDDAEHCVIYGCRVSQVAQYGIEVGPGSHANTIAACTLHDLGAGGVKVGHEELAGVPACIAPQAPAPRDRPMATLIADNQIHAGGRRFPSAVSVFIGNAGHNHILHNHIHDFHYSGISCGWTWGYAPSRTVGNRIEGNHLHHLAWTRWLHDLGGIYTLGVHPGSTIRRNYIHHVGGNGMYLDEGSSALLVEHNLVHDTDNLGFTLHYGYDNLVRHNVFALSGMAHFLPAATERHRSLVHHHNVFYWQAGEFVKNPWGGSDQWHPAHGLFHHNLLWDARGPRALDFGRGTSLADWQRQGQHHDTVLADPLFADPSGGDFTVRADSPLRALGITPLDPATTGPRLRGARPTYASWRRLHAATTAPASVLHTHWSQPAAMVAELRVQNLGTRPATGHLRLTVDTPAVQLERTVLRYRGLAPGASRTFTVRLTVAPAAPRRVVLATAPDDAAVLPAAIHLFVQPQDWLIAQLPSAPTVAALARRLARTPARMVSTRQGDAVATVRLAATGDALALVAQVTDHDLQAGELAWQGSVIELFTSPADAGQWHPSLGNGAIRQVYLLPPRGELPAAARWQDGTQERPAPTVALAATLTRTGYQLSALIPFTLLQLPPACPAWLLQLVITTTPRPGRPATRAALFYGGLSASGSNLLYGLVRVAE